MFSVFMTSILGIFSIYNTFSNRIIDHDFKPQAVPQLGVDYCHREPLSKFVWQTIAYRCVQTDFALTRHDFQDMRSYLYHGLVLCQLRL